MVPFLLLQCRFFSFQSNLKNYFVLIFWDKPSFPPINSLNICSRINYGQSVVTRSSIQLYRVPFPNSQLPGGSSTIASARKILKSKVHSDVSDNIELCMRFYKWRFYELSKACFISCLTFDDQKLIPMFSYEVKDSFWNTENLSLNWNYVVSGLYVLKSLMLWCLQRQSQNLSLATMATPWLVLAMLKLFLSF